MFGRKKNNDGPQAGYIKGRTAGKSNEISFSVLDAKTSGTPFAPSESSSKKKAWGRNKSNDMEKLPLFTLGGKGRNDVNATPKKEQGVLLPSGKFVEASKTSQGASLGSLQIESSDSLRSGSSASGRHSTATGSSESGEVARRKTRRISLQFAVVLAVVVVVAGIVTYTGTFFTADNKAHQTQVARLKVALNDVREVDETLVAMDKVLSNPIDMSSFDAMTEIETNAETLNATLEEARVITSSVLEVIETSSDRDAAEKCLKAISARKIMLEKGLSLIEESKNAAQAVELVLTAWNQIYNVDTLVKETAEILSAGGDLDLATADEKITKALSEMRAAEEQISAAAAMYPDANLSPQLDYAKTRYTAVKALYDATQSLIDAQLSPAQEYVAQFNEAEAQAAVLAKSLPTYPSEPIALQYMSKTSEKQEEYREARNDAAEVDVFLRNYLGR